MDIDVDLDISVDITLAILVSAAQYVLTVYLLPSTYRLWHEATTKVGSNS